MSGISLSSDKWKSLKFIVFDIPSLPLESYKNRYEILKKISKDFPLHIKVIDNIICKGEKHLKEVFQNIILNGGEGIVLRNPDSLYEFGKIFNDVKIKSNLFI